MRKSLFIMLPLVALFVLATAFHSDNTNNNVAGNPGEGFTIPDDISTIMDNKCFGCHNVDSKADKAKKKLLIDQLGDLSKVKLVSTLTDMAEVVKKGDMPPEKFLEKYPDKALSEEESAKLSAWAEKAADDLLK